MFKNSEYKHLENEEKDLCIYLTLDKPANFDSMIVNIVDVPGTATSKSWIYTVATYVFTVCIMLKHCCACYTLPCALLASQPSTL